MNCECRIENYLYFCRKIEMLEVKDATITAGGKTLVTGLSFIVRDGQLACVTGAEHAGKTTLLRTLMGFLPVEQGFVSIDGELLTVRSAHAFRKMMVYLPQEMQMLRHQLNVPEAPVCEAEDYAVWNASLPVVDPEPMAEPLSPEEIYLLAEQTIREAGDKQILIADEPAACLTPDLTERMVELLLQQAAMGKTVLITSRKPQLVAQAQQVIDLDTLRI